MAFNFEFNSPQIICVTLEVVMIKARRF